jgi:hypothetical protein
LDSAASPGNRPRLDFSFALGQAQKAVPMSSEPRFHVGFRTSIIALFVGIVLFVGLALVYLSFVRVTAASRASRHPTSPRQARAGVNLPSWEEEAVEHRLALADRAGRQKRIRRAKTLRIPRFILHAGLIRRSKAFSRRKPAPDLIRGGCRFA